MFMLPGQEYYTDHRDQGFCGYAAADDDDKNDELFVPGLARGPAGSNCQQGRNSGTDTTR